MIDPISRRGDISSIGIRVPTGCFVGSAFDRPTGTRMPSLMCHHGDSSQASAWNWHLSHGEYRFKNLRMAYCNYESLDLCSHNLEKCLSQETSVPNWHFAAAYWEHLQTKFGYALIKHSTAFTTWVLIEAEFQM